jgi:hypothetical protein
MAIQWVGGLSPKLAVTIIKRSYALVGFTVLPHRWIVERAFAV